MLQIKFGFDKDCIRDIDLYFDNVYDEEWFSDELVKKMVYDIDKSEVVSKQCINSPVLGQIPPERLSGGVKALICLYKCELAYIDLIVCGENCEKWIKDIAELRDITVGMSGYDLSFEKCGISGVCLNDKSIINNYHDYISKMCAFVEESDER